MRNALNLSALLFVVLGCLALAGCGGRNGIEPAPDAELPPGLAEALEGRHTGDLIPTNDASFQLQLSALPSRFIVRMQASREAVAPKVSAYFRNLGVDDLASVNLMWCESLKRGVQDVWSCNR